MAGGDDEYAVDEAADWVIEAAGAGYDTVRSWTSYTLPANVERLELLGAADLSGTGNAGPNVLVGNAGANRLDGRGGGDRLEGGPGDDTYVVDSPGDLVVEHDGEGIDRVVAHVDHAPPENVENLVLRGGAVRGWGNGLGNAIVGNALDNVLMGFDGGDLAYAYGRTGGFGGISLAQAQDSLASPAFGHAMDPVRLFAALPADAVRLA